MLTVLDPLALDPIAYDQGVLDDMRAFSLLPERRIGWNYCMDYTWIADRFRRVERPIAHALDIGCGPGAIHGYLEQTHSISIVGVDLHRWDHDYVDLVGDVFDPEVRTKGGLAPGTLDVIVSASAFEHMPPAQHERVIALCLELLRPGGHLITTFSVAGRWSHRIRNPQQWNLSRQRLAKMYAQPFEPFDYREVWRRYREHREMADLFRQRFKRMRRGDPHYIAAGAHVRKSDDGKRFEGTRDA